MLSRCRRGCLLLHLRHWQHSLDIRDAFEQLCDSCWQVVLRRRALRMLRWWQQWRVQHQHKEQQEEASWEHMAALRLGRCEQAAAMQ